MPRPPFRGKLFVRRRRAPEPPAGPKPSGRYNAPGDPPLELPSISLDAPFAFDAEFARRLIRRDINIREAFTVRDAAGACYRASVKELGEGGGKAVAYERMPRSPEPSIELTLACAVLARQRMIFVAQKATELGVCRIVPLFTEYSVQSSGLEHEKARAWPGQLVRAAKQCRRGSLPELLPPASLDAFLVSPHVEGADLCLRLDDVAGPRPEPKGEGRRITLLVGPEGGFSPSERATLEGKAAPWMLGGRILRAETAVLAGLTAVHLAWGDFR
ncbi:MAG: 16S rRNA (uracil(1498)-N(3))-methyltransferase [Elusimicrobia bacterium]|nr:16S rRNA (uracil(1498)-N(3))-methyltransferase [Elusimicrobiota bacterium]